MVSVFGTMAADVLHVGLGVPYTVSTPVFLAALAAVFGLWYAAERTLSIHSIHTRRQEVFYWATVLSTFALGTAAGDLTATDAGLGYFGSGVLFAALIALPVVAHQWPGLNAIAAFWSAYVVPRPLGASFADWMAVSTGRGGLGDASIRIWRIRDGSELTMSGYPEKVSRLTFDDTGFWLTADGAPDVMVWDFSGNGPVGTAPRSLRCHETITALAWRPGAAGRLASGGHDGTVALWHATAGRPQALLRPARTLEDDVSAVAALAWAGPHLLITAHRDGRVRAYGLPSRTAL